MHGVYRYGYLFICQGEEPPHATFYAVRHLQAQGLNEQLVSELLRDQKTAWLRIVQFLAQALKRPAQYLFFRLFTQMDNGREQAEKDFGMIAVEYEMATDKQAISTPVVGVYATIHRRRESLASVDRRQLYIACKNECSSRRQKETFPRCQMQCVD